MNRFRGSDVASLADRAASAYADERKRLRRAAKHVDADQHELAARLAQAWEQLTVTLVPGLAAEHLDWAATLIYLPSIASAQVQARIALERTSLIDERAAIDANPDYVNRELKLNECAIQIAELERPLAPLHAALDPLEALNWFHSLLASNYDTPEHTHKWYELAYYRDWKHGDAIVEQFGEPRGLTSFAQLRARYHEEADARRTLAAELAIWVAERARVEALVARQAWLSEALDTLEDRHWALTRGRVYEHLYGLEDDLLDLLGSYEPGLYAAKRVAGIIAKQRYIAAMRAAWIDEPLAQVARRLSKAQRAGQKYRRPKHAGRQFPADEIQRKFSVPTSGWQKRWGKWEAAYPRILAYDSYDDYRREDPTIWWHHMTGGAVKARFIPEVGHYYEQIRLTKDWAPADDQDDAHEQAIAALIDEGSGSTSERDAWDDVS